MIQARLLTRAWGGDGKSRFFFSSRRRHTRYIGDWSSDVCSSDLQKPVVGLEVHQESQLLEDRIVLDELRFVDDDDAVTPGLVVPEEEVVEKVQQLGLARLLRLDPQLVEHLAQKIDRRPARIGEKADLVALGLEALDERARQGRLAAAVLPGEHPAALAVAHRVDQADQRLLVLGR